MAEPPSYEESTSKQGNLLENVDGDSKQPVRLSVREEVGVGRSQHVAAIATTLLPHVRARARRGLSKTTLLLLPSTQGLRWADQDGSSKGRLVGFPPDETPILVQLECGRDTLEFWTQKLALELLQSQMLDALSEGTAPEKAAERPMPPRPPPPSTKTSFWGRKQSKAAEVDTPPPPKASKPPVEVVVKMDEAHFRTETEYGLYETLRVRCVMVAVEVR